MSDEIVISIIAGAFTLAASPFGCPPEPDGSDLAVSVVFFAR